MNHRENLISLYKRNGFEKIPVYFVLCPTLQDEFKKRYGPGNTYQEYFALPAKVISDPGFSWNEITEGFVPKRNFDWAKYYPVPVKPGTRIDIWGVAHEPGGPGCVHMTLMRHPLENVQTLKEMEEYPWPDFYKSDFTVFQKDVDKAHAQGYAAHVWMECTVWELACTYGEWKT